MKDHSSDHEFFSESLCGNRRSRIVEIDSTEIDVYVEQHHEDEDVPFDGAYAIVNGDMDSGTFGMTDGWQEKYYKVCVRPSDPHRPVSAFRGFCSNERQVLFLLLPLVGILSQGYPRAFILLEHLSWGQGDTLRWRVLSMASTRWRLGKGWNSDRSIRSPVRKPY